MTPYRKQDQKTYTITIATGDRANPYVRLSTGTRDLSTAREMEQMLKLFSERGQRRMTWVRDAVVARRLSIGEAYDAYVEGTLDALRARLEDRDLGPLVAEWEAALDRQRTDGTMAAETIRKYRSQVRVLVGAGPLWRTVITSSALKARLDAVPGSGTNRRRHAAAWSHFLDHCVEVGALEANPLRTMKLPKSNATRERHIDWPLVVRLLHAMPAGVHRALAALRHGAGLEMQAALAVRRRDVDLETRVVWAHGLKNTHRDRQAIVLDDGCWEILQAWVREGGFLPDALVFPVSHKVHATEHKQACAALRAEGVAVRDRYTLHAARHSFGVEMTRRGHEAKLIAANYGHANEALVMKLYAKYRLRAEDLIRAAKRAQGGTR